jgi:putative peptidoglycan lipid II flippase
MLPSTDITIQEPPTEADEVEARAQLERREGSASAGRIARAAIVLMAGTILSRVLGLGREVVIADLFGAGAQVDAFRVANHVATIVYDLLIAGTVSAALVPVFSEYAGDETKRPELARVVSTILTVAGLFLLVSVALLELAAAPLVGFMGADFPDETRSLALEMTQWVLPGVFFMGLSGVVMAAHYALGRFVYPAFTSATFNAAIIFAAITLAGLFGIKSLVLGMVLGAIAMLVIQAPGLRDIPLRPVLDFRHPAVRKIFALYAPVGLSVVVSSIALVIDRNLASRSEGWISAMSYATTLVQFGLGMVAAAISLAALPSLSQHFSRGNRDAYKRTLASGLRLVMVLALPTAAGLLALAHPLVALIFEHGAYTAADRELTVQALLLYVIGFPFGAIDQVLIIAFYARKNTLTPVLVGIAAVGVYLAVAFSLVDTMGMRGLVLANSAQLTFHAIVTGLLLWRAMRAEGGLHGYGIGDTTLKVAGAAAALALVSYAVWWALDALLHPASFLEKLVVLGLPVIAGGATYAALVRLMRLPEVELIAGKVAGRLRPYLRLVRRG